MDLQGLVNKAKDALKGNPSLIDKGGDAIDKATGGKFHDQVDKAQEAVKNVVGAEDDKPAPAPEQPSTPPAEDDDKPAPPPSNP